VTKADIEALLKWDAKAPPSHEIAFTPARVIMQDFTGVPCIVDLAAMREAIVKLGGDPQKVNPLAPAELVIDHSVQVDEYGAANSLQHNNEIEFQRNGERYMFLRWGQTAFSNFKVVPPNTGIVHQVNIERLVTPQATTKAALLSAFARYRTIDPGDVFLFYIASHGIVVGEALASREYFMIPSNLSTNTEEAIRHDALSENEVKQAIASIPATRKLLLLDTCHSGAMGDAMIRGLEELAAVKVLSGAVGSTVLSASTSDQEALEGQDGHGLFTWVLLQGLNGSADFRKNGSISTFDLADYVDDEVPKVAEAHFSRKQIPNLHNAGQSFQIVSSR